MWIKSNEKAVRDNYPDKTLSGIKYSALSLLLLNAASLHSGRFLGVHANVHRVHASSRVQTGESPWKPSGHVIHRSFPTSTLNSILNFVTYVPIIYVSACIGSFL